MSKKIADLNIDDAEFLNDSLMDFYNDGDTVDPLDEQEEDSITDNVIDTSNTFVDTEEEDTSLDAEVDDDSDVEVDTVEDTEEVVDKPDSLEDYNTLALLALSLQEEDPELLDFTIDKDIKPEALITNLKTTLNKTRENVTREVQENYGEAARYLKMILEGASQNEVSIALSYNQIASLDITGNEDEAQLEQVVKSWLTLKGSPDVADLIEVYKDKGVLTDKAREAVEFHREQEAIFFDNWQQNRNAQIAQAQKAELEYQRAIKTQINKGVVKGLAIKDKKKFEESLFKPTEIVEFIDESGKKRLQKVPLINVKMQEFHQDIEQQLALQLLVLDGFDFSSLVEKAKRKVSSNLINTLNDRTSTPGVGRRSSSTYFED
jgi:hypothetical protein